jgi:carboxyl-terminal processing protease
MKRLIVDLRENEGGILPIAIRMINEFLPEGKLILYTQGKASPRMDYNSNGKGKYQQLPLTVLIDEASASASEIFAGAIQDNDRGNIVLSVKGWCRNKGCCRIIRLYD